ncbi:hydrophobe/amphiphile efflux-1 HAE1 family protein [Candidatus Phycorickettsia trachydisci]|uniref:Hydrophobe/amphiphile efflux-1 HAE1 family protein n=1 Tax=Candidatus Phycorickettsia trachydisci TaxID=2115978 RepID=A0A2P1P8G1_9RICK|nr:efflux RND transporter permease subunit [Candidatus Phycorickettsia trachydisci]AVP87546.1 hydrophobe/amphiphile efflux-1 HAE1 family protein [Candidatus Phycorickettsia trachydisci]
MRISEICIKRPVFATVMSLMILLIGLVSFSKLTIRGAPDVDPPLISITASYGGASAEYMANKVTTVLEQAMRSIKQVDFITSQSSTGTSKVNIFFTLDADIDQALSDVRSQISQISLAFPSDMQIPQASKQDADSNPSIFLIVRGDNYTKAQLTDIAQKQILLQLERVDAVGTGIMRGPKFNTVIVKLDPLKLYQYNLDPTSIANTINSQNTDYPAGIIKTDKLNFVVNLDARIKLPEQFNDIVITKIANRVIHLRDIADVSFEPTDPTSVFKFNGQEALAIGLVKQSKANILDLSKQVTKALPSIIKTLPAGINISVRYDAALPVSDSINEVIKAVIESLILVFIVVYFFLGSAQITLIPVVTIPVSLVGTFYFMHLAGFSINTFSLLAMVLAIGLVVDDAIVVLENSYRYVQQGLSSIEASIKSMNEIGFAVLVMTTTLASVFIPIGFLEGFVGRLFIEFAWTLAFCVILSGFVAITLSPMMCSRLISVHNESQLPLHLAKFAHFIHYVENLYVTFLHRMFKNQKKFFMICGSSIFLLVLGFSNANKSFIPVKDDGALMLICLIKQGTSLAISEQYVDLLQKEIKKIPEVENVISVATSSGGFGYIILKDWSERSRSQKQIRDEINMKLSRIPEVSAFTSNLPSVLSGTASKAVEFNLQGLNASWEELEKTAYQFIDELQNYTFLSNFDLDYKSTVPGINIFIDKDKAQMYNTSIPSIGNTLNYLMTTQNINSFLMDDLIYNVQVGFGIADRSHINDLTKVYIKSNDGKMLPLKTFAKIQETAKVQSYNHYNNLKTISLSADIKDTASLGMAANAINTLTQKIIDPSKIKVEFLGNIKRMSEQSSSLLFVFALSIFFIYLVLAAQFESFKDPLIILLSVPFSITGAILTILICRNSINLYSAIGIITLIGLVTKNAIMIVEFANQMRHSSLSLYESIIKAAQIRFRPIMMTSLSTALGAMPLVLASGGGAAARVSIGLVIFGGMIIGTLFTLFVIPFVYVKFNREVNT